MTKVEVELHEDIINVLNKLKTVTDPGIELVVPEGAVLFENILNLKILKKWSDDNNKILNFSTEDENGQNMLLLLEEDSTKTGFSDNDDEDDEQTDNTKSIEENIKKHKLIIPKFKFPRFRFGKGKFIIAGIITALLIIGGYFGYKLLSELPQAEVKIIVNSQPLTRSFEIKVKNGAKNDAASEEKILRGTTIEASIEEEVTIQTTGEKIIGEKAKGSVTIYNKTDEEKKFKKGTELTYKDKDDDEYKFELTKDVTVPERVVEEGETLEDPSTIVNGKADVEVEAKEIGDDYNVDDGESLEIEDQKTSEFEAEVSEDIDGGKTEKLKTVSQDDIDQVKIKVLENAEENAIRALERKVEKDQKLVAGSTLISPTEETFSRKLDEEAEELTLKQKVVSKGLIYTTADLDKLIDEIAETFIPEGYVLSTKERVVNVEILGNTESTVLSELEADIQVTIKTYVVPDISEQEVKNDLYGKSVNDAQRILGSIKNVKTYEFNLSPRIPFFDNVPNDENRVNVTLVRE